MSINDKKATVFGILTQLLFLLVLAKGTMASPLSEKVKIEGIIVDAQTGEPLPAAHLSLIHI